MNVETALITGASSGIGLHLANEFAAHGHPLILVAPVQSELDRIAAALGSAHGVPVRSIGRELEQPESASAIFEEIQSRGTWVDILVNSAGHGFLGKFMETSLEQDL